MHIIWFNILFLIIKETKKCIECLNKMFSKLIKSIERQSHQKALAKQIKLGKLIRKGATNERVW